MTRRLLGLGFVALALLAFVVAAVFLTPAVTAQSAGSTPEASEEEKDPRDFHCFGFTTECIEIVGLPSAVDVGSGAVTFQTLASGLSVGQTYDVDATIISDHCTTTPEATATSAEPESNFTIGACHTAAPGTVSVTVVLSLNGESLSTWPESMEVEGDLPPEVTIEAGTSPITEGENAVFTVEADPAPSTNLTVDITVDESGSFLSGTPPSTVLIPANSDSVTLTLPTIDDAVVENDGSVTVTIDSGSGYTVGNPASDTVVIEDNEPVVTIEAGPSPITEGQNAVFTLTAIPAPTTARTVRITVAEDGSFLSGTPPSTVQLVVNSTSATLTLPTVDDAVVENDGSVTVTIDSGSGYTVGNPASDTVVIEDNEPVVTITSVTSRITEGDNTVFRLTAIPAPTTARTVNITVAETGSFLRDSPPSTVQLVVNSTLATLTLPTIDDAVVENDGSVTVTIDSGSGYTVGNMDSDTVAIEDNEPEVTIEAGTSPITEGRNAVFTLRADPAPTTPRTVRITVAEDGSFLSGTPPPTVELVVNSTFTTLSLPTTDDATVEEDGGVTVFIRLSGGYTVGNPASDEVDIEDNEPEVTIEAATSPITEGENAVFTLTASPVPTTARTVNITVNETGSYLTGTIPSTVLIPANRSSATLILPTEDDAVVESNGSVIVTIGSGSGYTVGSLADSDIVVIENDDEVSLEISDLVAEMEVDSSTSFKVDASDLDSATTYRLRVTASNNGLENDCSTQGMTHEVDITSGNTMHTETIGLRGCQAGPATVEAELVEGGTSRATAAQTVVVKNPSIAMERLDGTVLTGTIAMEEGADIPFSVKVLSLVSLTRYTILVETTGDVGLDNACDMKEELTLPSGTTQFTTTSFTLHGCSIGSGELTATLKGGSSDKTTSVDVTVTPPQLAAPMDLAITPFPQRKARLTWTEVPNATSYDVYIREVGKDWPQVRTVNIVAPDSHHDLSLDNILTSRGLADATTYELRIKAKAATNNPSFSDSDYSDEIRIIDTPITVANGDSRGRTSNNGKAEIQWSPVADVKQYKIRWRKLSAFGAYPFEVIPHTDLRWRPQPATSDQDWSGPHNLQALTDTINGLEVGEVYAIQVNYDYEYQSMLGTVIAGKGFSAREAYVWPSDRAAHGETIAGMPLVDRPIIAKTPDGNIAYFYRICDDTFPSADWVPFINHALLQWQYATGGLVRMVHQVDANGQSRPCADYSDFLDEITTKVSALASSGATAGDIELEVGNLLQKFREHGIKSSRTGRTITTTEEREHDLLLNEILMVDAATTSLSQSVFTQISADIAISLCASACAYPDVVTTDFGVEVRTTDIYLREDVHGRKRLIDLSGGDEINFNTCPDTSDRYNYPYSSFVHEAGHALGIVHPEMADSIMNYIVTEPDCSPHPFDVLAIHALYQLED